ncbi:MAG: amidohydrolase family protein [Chloroflexi bacterium]|nr:amidohydrolase family protein [Chloroflexota bacterium]
MIIDFHTHTFPDEVRKDRGRFMKNEDWFRTLYDNPRARTAAPEDVIESMDEAGVDKAVLLGFCWSQHENCVEHNDFTIEAVHKFPDRFIGFASLQPKAGKRAVAEIERCVSAGLRGIGEWNPSGQRFDLNEDREAIDPVVEAAIHFGIPILIHTTEPVGHHYKGKGGAELGHVYHLAKQFPDLRLVCAHWGGGLPFYELMPEVAESSRNLYYDTAASPFLYRPSIFRIVPHIIGIRRILFGTDFPLIGHTRFLNEIRSQHLPTDTREAFLGNNARAILGLGE